MDNTLICELERFVEQIIVDGCQCLQKFGCDHFCDGKDCIIIRTIDTLKNVPKEKKYEID